MGQAASFYRLTIRNRGKTPAEICRVYLVSVRLVKDGVAGPDLLGKPQILKWAHEANFDAVTIEAGDSRKLDLFYKYHNRPDEFRMFVEPTAMPIGTVAVFPIAEYRIKIRVHLGNQVATTAEFSLSADASTRLATVEKV